MKIRFVIGTCIVVVAWSMAVGHLASAQPPAHQWSKHFGNTSSQGPGTVATDALGNVVMTGYMQGTVDFGGGPLVSAGGEDVYVAKFNSAGGHVWSKRFGNNNAQRGAQVAVDAPGNIIVAGFFKGTLDFGGGNLIAAGPGYDGFVAKLDANGAHVWSRRFGDTDGQYATCVAVDGAGNAFVGGFFAGSADFGGGIVTSTGTDDAFVTKYDPTGGHLWSLSFGDTMWQDTYDVATDAMGNVVLTGNAFGTVDFGGGPLTGAGGAEVFAAKFTPTGTHVWSDLYGGSGNYTSAHSVAIDGSNNVILAGGFGGTVDFGGGPMGSAGLSDAYLAKLTAGGIHLWSQRFGDAGGNQYATSVVAGPLSRNVLITGFTSGPVNFGGGLLTNAGTDILLAMFTPDGAYLWSELFGDASAQWGYSVAMDASENVFMHGHYGGTVDFGGGPLTAGSVDNFIAKFGATPTGVADPPPSLAQSIAAFPNPFNPGTTISYAVQNRGDVRVAIYDARGARIVTLVNEEQGPGAHAVQWDGRDARGAAVSSGVYFVRVLASGSTPAVAKIALLK